MADSAELSQKDIKTLFGAMGEELATYGSQFAFIQLRVSAEHFVVPLCGLSVERIVRLLKPDQYHVYFERKLPGFKQGPVDLVLIPIANNGNDELDKAYCFEFKMAWFSGIQQNLSGINKDIEKLNGYNRGFIIAVLFSFDKKLSWAPYSHEGDMEQLVRKVISSVGLPIYEGHEYSISNHEVAGKLKLLAWSAIR